MGLQLRLAGSPAERMTELTPRSSREPHVIGRGPGATLRFPAAADIADRHCLIFAHQGRWYIHDANTPTGTFVNRQRVTQPRLLNSGDLITLGTGPDAPQLVVDPNGLGTAADSPLPQPSLPPFRARPASPAQPHPVAPVAAPPAEEPQPEHSEWDDIPRTTRYYVPKPKKDVGATAATIALLTLLAVAAGAYILYNVRQRQQAATQPVIVVVKPPPGDAPATRPTTIFDNPPAPRKTVAAGAAPSRPATEPAEIPPPPDPRRKSQEWLDVEQARHDDPVIAIVKFDLYRSTYPDTFTKDLDQYTEEALDRLWWQRIVELFKERDDARAEIARRQQDLRTSSDPEFKKGLEDEIAKFAEARNNADNVIANQMLYKSEAPPNLYDSQDLAALRTQRDPELYQAWKKAVLKSILSSRGQRLPWKQTR